MCGAMAFWCASRAGVAAHHVCACWSCVVGAQRHVFRKVPGVVTVQGGSGLGQEGPGKATGAAWARTALERARDAQGRSREGAEAITRQRRWPEIGRKLETV